ncbi:receptor-type tyrosine-protein phosphatase N2 [Arapaima gigas]
MDPRSSVLLLLLDLLVLVGAGSADGRFGCMFEDTLCQPYEICTNDAVFGRCQPAPVTDFYIYQVSPSILQHLRSLLQKLARRGLTWEDDATQQAVGQELSKLRKVFLRHPESSSANGGTWSRAPNQNLRSMEVELDRSLHSYLQHLGLLSQQATPSGQRPKSKRPPSQRPLDRFHFPSQGKGVSQMTVHSPAVPFQPPVQNGAPPVQLPPARVGEKLVAALQQYLRGRLPGSSAPGRGMLENPDAHRVGSVPQTAPQRSGIDHVLFKAGTTGMEPLSQVDEEFIRKVVTQLGRHNVDMDTLSGRDLEQLADTIADALEVVDAKVPRDPQPPAEQKEVKAMPALPVPLAKGALLQVRDESDLHFLSPVWAQGAGLVSKLLEYLDRDSYDEEPRRNVPEDGGQGTAGAVAVGVETVKSRTTQTDIAMEKKEAAPLAPAPDRTDPAEMWEEPQKKDMRFEEELQLDVKSVSAAKKEDLYGYIITDSDSLSTDQGLHLMKVLARYAKLNMNDFLELSVVSPVVTFRVRPNAQNLSTADVARVAVKEEDALEKETGLGILEAGVTDKSTLTQLPTRNSQAESTKFLILTVISIVCIIGVLVASTVVYALRHRSHHKLKEKLTSLATDTGSGPSATYQELCRQRMAMKTSERPEPAHASRINSVSSQFSDGPMPSPSARSSTSSWCEEPVQSNMDISTGHMILSYMEDHLKNKNRLEKEWEALCAYQAEPNACTVGLRDGNSKKNRSSAMVAYDHSRITLKTENNQGSSDYINASPIMDHDPRNPAYIATQGPLPATVADFWQMVWENGCVVIVMLTSLTENGVKQCYHYWPDEGSNLYHIYEVNLVSEHIWCEDFLVRSFYLKNMQTNETRTVTQFHFLTWMNQSVPESSRTLLDFRRKVNKCYRGRSCPIIVHCRQCLSFVCSDGAGRTGTYILIDMVLNKMAKGAKEIDIAATLEHLRDQRQGMVQTKEQFEFALTAVAEEVNVILKALPQ